MGGETHIKEITSLNGSGLKIVGTVVRKEQVAWARESLQAEVYTKMEDLMAAHSPRIIVVANENYRKPAVIKHCHYQRMPCHRGQTGRLEHNRVG